MSVEVEILPRDRGESYLANFFRAIFDQRMRSYDCFPVWKENAYYFRIKLFRDLNIFLREEKLVC